jgi:hypothetical protein
MAAFLLFLSAGMTFITKAPRSLREKATIVSELEPGKLYKGYVIYQPDHLQATAEETDEFEDGNISHSGIRRLFFGNTASKVRKTG